ncbi:hypothetical protein DFQ28_001346 [Apophysomyces sp. BC1034]|nr:hypothetical protein DFQ30_001668 [Apophysomyces sp. BC1015]KAG0180353.1 hypothetical protein DFQ29_000831 [Apophysomyces sp. BC1021]KAG0190908.1 hypothetical protein DFQ28_001346 [Apophysomyces sp. BC1034]
MRISLASILALACLASSTMACGHSDHAKHGNSTDGHSGHGHHHSGHGHGHHHSGHSHHHPKDGTSTGSHSGHGGHSGHGTSTGGHSKTGTGKAFDHILQVWFENEDFALIDSLPQFKSLESEGITLTNFNALTHPSEPNYVAAGGGSTFGLTNDDYYRIPANISTIYDLLEAKGLTWRLYQEDLPYTGFTGYKYENKDGTYMRKHNPAVSFDSVALNKTRLQNIVNAKELEKDIESGNLPNWMFYTPNMNNDGHDTNATYAGNWLQKFYKSTLNNPKLLENTLVLLTWDENKTYPIRNHIWSLLLGKVPEKLKGTRDDTFYTHYSTLSTVEYNWDLGTLGRGDANKTLANVFNFLAPALNYTNVHVPVSEIEFMNNTITGFMTGKSLNETQQA